MKKEGDYGTNHDGSKSKEYCHFCFKSGGFTDEGITMEQKINKWVELGVSQLCMTEKQARDMANGIIPHLKRWKK